MLKPLSATAALVLAAALVTPTVSHAETTSASVSFADLNLSNKQAQRTLQYRIESAAQSLCAFGASGRDFGIAQAANACRSGAIASAQPAYDAAIAAARRGTVTVLGTALTVTAQ